jgi:hypothetical protein
MQVLSRRGRPLTDTDAFEALPSHPDVPAAGTAAPGGGEHVH